MITIGFVVVAIIGLVVFLYLLSFFQTWLKAVLANATVGFTTLVAMRLRGVPYGIVVDAKITAVKAGINLTEGELEAHYLAGGNLIPTVQAIIAAKQTQ